MFCITTCEYSTGMKSSYVSWVPGLPIIWPAIIPTASRNLTRSPWVGLSNIIDRSKICSCRVCLLGVWMVGDTTVVERIRIPWGFWPTVIMSGSITVRHIIMHPRQAKPLMWMAGTPGNVADHDWSTHSHHREKPQRIQTLVECVCVLAPSGHISNDEGWQGTSQLYVRQGFPKEEACHHTGSVLSTELRCKRIR